MFSFLQQCSPLTSRKETSGKERSRYGRGGVFLSFHGLRKMSILFTVYPLFLAYSHANKGKDKLPLPIASRNHPMSAHPALTAFPHSLRWIHRSRIPEAEILSHKPKHMPESKSHPQKLSERQSHYHESVLISISWFPTSCPFQYDNVCSYGKCSNIRGMCMVIEFPIRGGGRGVTAGAALAWGRKGDGVRRKVDGGHKIIIVYHLGKSRSRSESPDVTCCYLVFEL